MIWVHDRSEGSVQNTKRNLVVKINNNLFVLKKESEILESDIIDFSDYEYFEWLAKGNTPEIADKV
jgi:hypothetical protein